jgi:hypothetical protein
VYDYQSQVYKSLGYVQSYSDIVNQKRVLTSYDLIDAALNKLDFDISYFIVGRFKTSQVYGTLALHGAHRCAGPKRCTNGRSTCGSWMVNSYELSYDRNGKIVKRGSVRRGCADPENQFIIKVDRSPCSTRYGPGTGEGTDYQFIKHERSNLVKKYKGRIAVDNQEFTTILDVTVEDEVGCGPRCSWTPSRRNTSGTRCRASSTSTRTRSEYIDKQLGEVTVILERTRMSCRPTRRTRISSTFRAKRACISASLVKYDQLQRRNLELEVQSSMRWRIMCATAAMRNCCLPPSSSPTMISCGRPWASCTACRWTGTRTCSPDGGEHDHPAFDSTIQLNKANLLTYIKNARQRSKGKIGDIQGIRNDYEG